MASIHSDTEWESLQLLNKKELNRIDEITKCVATRVQSNKRYLHYLHSFYFISDLRPDTKKHLCLHLSKMYPDYRVSIDTNFIEIQTKTT